MQPFVMSTGLYPVIVWQYLIVSHFEAIIHKFAYLMSSPQHLSDAQFTKELIVVGDK